MIKFVNFRASDIEPNPNEVLYWVDLNEDPTGGSIKYWNKKGYWLTIRVLEGTLHEFEEKITNWVTEELQKQTEWVEDLVHQFDGRIAIVEGDILNLYTVKLDKLIPGYGIEITEDNTINCTVDLSLYRVVAELPTEDIDESKIYIVFDPDGTGTNTHEEYVYVDGKWELLGKYADYASRTEFLQEVEDRKAADQLLQESITKEISDRLSDITRVESLIKTEETSRIESDTTITDSLNLEIENRTNADSQINLTIATEVNRLETLLESNNTNLSTKLQEEIERSTTKDTEHDTKISEEVARAIAAEEKLTQDLNAEIERSTTIDGTHTNKISALETKATELGEEIDAEVNRATAKETELNETITNEISRATQKESEIETSLNLFKSTKGQSSGLASLDENGRVPSSQLPSYVDDVIEADTLTAFPETGESGKIYIAKDTNKTYRWSGTDYAEISASLALGETSSTAYAGDKGKANRDALLSLPDTIVGGNANNITFSYDSTNVSLRYNYTTKSEMNYTLASSPSIRPINAATTTTAGVMTAADKAKLDGISSGANTYTHPVGSAPSKPVGLYKISTDANSHIASTTAVTKADITALGIPGSDTNTTYTFANGTDGSFTVTPSGGSALKVTIGKPATAGTADTATDCVKKTGDTMTGDLNLTNGNNVTFNQNTEANDCGDLIWYTPSKAQRARIFTPAKVGTSSGLYICGSSDTYNNGVLFLDTDILKFLNKNIWWEGNLSPVTTNTELTITGKKTFLFPNISSCYVLKNSSNASSYLRYENGNGLLGYFGILSTTREPFFRKDTTELIYKIWHEGNDGPGSGLYADYTNGALNGALLFKQFEKNDNGGRDTFLLIADCSSLWQTTEPSNHYGFNGTIIYERSNGYPTNGVANVVAKIGYDKEHYLLSSSNWSIGVCIVLYNSKYYVAFRLKASAFKGYAFGNWKNTLSTFIQLHVPSGQTLPTGMTIIYNGNSYWNGKCETAIKVSNPITFTGAVTGTYDGSAAKTVNIPAASTRASLGIDTDDAVVFAKVTASGGFWKESDKRLKSNIKPLLHTIEQITSIPTVEFDMNDKHLIGTIAQDIETVVPEVVSESDGIKKVEYSMMGVLAIEGIKLLKQEIEDLKKEIELLKNK